MVLDQLFLTPIGLLALLGVLPLLLFYLFKPEPRTYRLPTFEFLRAATEGRGRHPVLDRFRRNALLVFHLLVLVLVATALGSPYVAVPEDRVVEETVVVIDSSASMATRTDGTTRFDRAVARAGDEVAATTAIVTTAPTPTVRARGVGVAGAREAMAGLGVTDSPGDLRAGIDRAAAVAGEGARIVVVSDFADASDWRTAVRTARASGVRVDLVGIGGGGGANVGIVDRSFAGTNVTLTVRNYGDAPASRTLRFAGAGRTLQLEPGDAVTVRFAVPPGGGTARLTPGDDFPTDDTVVVAAPDRAEIAVLLVTNDENRFLRTALSLIDVVDLEVVTPPASVTGPYDVVVFSNVNPDRLLRGTVDVAHGTVEAGGGVAIQAQPDLEAVGYGDLLIVEPDGLESGPSLVVRSDRLTDGIGFPPPDTYLVGDLRAGRELVGTTGGTPLIATADRGTGRLLYYGYIEAASAFKYNYLYPVFWKRAVYHLADRPTLNDLNRRTGEGLSAPTERSVETPVGVRTTDRLVFAHAGSYRIGETRYAAALLDPVESDVVAVDPAGAGDGPAIEPTATDREVPVEVTPAVVLGAGLLVLGELAFLRRRGDL